MSTIQEHVIDQFRRRTPVIYESLSVVEDETQFRVVLQSDASDWFMAFDKSWGEQAKVWAYRVARLHNDCLAGLH